MKFCVNVATDSDCVRLSLGLCSLFTFVTLFTYVYFWRPSNGHLNLLESTGVMTFTIRHTGRYPHP